MLPAASADKVDRREQGAIEAVAAGGQDELGAARCDERADAGALDRGRGGGSSRCSMTAAGGVAGSASYAIVVGEKNGGRPQKKRRTGSSVRGKASSRLKGEVIEGTARAVGWRNWAAARAVGFRPEEQFFCTTASLASSHTSSWRATAEEVGGPHRGRLEGCRRGEWGTVAAVSRRGPHCRWLGQSLPSTGCQR